MVEIGQFFESALRSQREELKQAALEAVARMGGASTVAELLASDAGQGIRQLTLRDLRDALPDLEAEARVQAQPESFEQEVANDDGSASDAERIYLEILELLQAGPLTIGQISKQLEFEVDGTELRAYLAWMRQMGKVQTSGRARAMRYHLPDY